MKVGVLVIYIFNWSELLFTLYQTVPLESHVYHLIDYQEVIIRFVSLCQTACSILLLRIQISVKLCVLPVSSW